MPTDASLPNYCRPELQAVADDLALVHDLLGGTRRMHDQTVERGYIRKWTDEDPAVYKIRREGESVFEGLGRTLSAATGMLFAKAPHLEWNQSETAMAPHWDNLDAAGTKGTVLVKRFADASLRDGLGAILVDHTSAPKTEDGPKLVTGKVEQDMGLRPTWALYGRGQVINWRTALVNNQRVLSLVVFHEVAEVEDGLFGITSVHRYRVLRLLLTPDGYQATWTLYQTIDPNASKPEEFTVVGGGVFRNKAGQVATFLPVSTAYTGRTEAPMTSSVPLLGVAWANLAHWQLSTDLRFYRSLSAFPQPVVIGTLAPDAKTGAPGRLRFGPMVGIQLAAENGASFEWKELAGTSMEQLEKGIAEKLAQMSKLGLAFLQQDKRVMETAEAKRLDATAQNSTLATAAQGIEDAVNGALEHHAWYLGIEKAGAPVLTISREYDATTMQADMLTAWVGAIANAGLPIRILLEAMQVGGLIGPDEDLDALEAEVMANQAAIAAEKAAQLADAAASATQDTMPPAKPAQDMPAAA